LKSPKDIETFNTNRLAKNVVITDYVNRMLKVVENNKALMYLTQTEMTELNEQKLRHRKKQVKMNEIHRAQARILGIRAFYEAGEEEGEEEPAVVLIEGENANEPQEEN